MYHGPRPTLVSPGWAVNRIVATQPDVLAAQPPLAMAAYNAGEGTVQKLIERFKAACYDSIAPLLPAETKLYVPKV